MHARRVRKGVTYLITRRTVQRQFLINPSKTVNQILLFCLAHAAERYGVEVHCFCFLGNHYHLVVTDPKGQLPEFMRWFNEHNAKCLNVHHGRAESVWAPGSFSAVELGDDEAVLDKIIYTLCNPVEAGLVREGDDWPGLRTKAWAVGRGSYTAVRPNLFFDPGGPVPEEVTMTLTPPPAFRNLSPEEFASLIKRKVLERESEIQGDFDRDKRKFFGRRNVLAQSPTETPTSREPRRELNPRLASKDKWKRIELIGLLKGFLREYREALQRFRDGEKGVVFPHGTYLMKVRFGVRCAPT